jgi:hypothetical protein
MVSIIQIIKKACYWPIKATATTGNFPRAVYKHWLAWCWTWPSNLPEEMIYIVKDLLLVLVNHVLFYVHFVFQSFTLLADRHFWILDQGSLMYAHEQNYLWICKVLQFTRFPLYLGLIGEKIYVWDRPSSDIDFMLQFEHKINFICFSPNEELCSTQSANPCWGLEPFFVPRSILIKFVYEVKIDHTKWWNMTEGFILLSSMESTFLSWTFQQPYNARLEKQEKKGGKTGKVLSR